MGSIYPGDLIEYRIFDISQTLQFNDIHTRTNWIYEFQQKSSIIILLSVIKGQALSRTYEYHYVLTPSIAGWILKR